MKIVFLSLKSGSINRGVETVVSELSKRLGKKHEVTVIQAGEKIEKENCKSKKINISINWQKGEKPYSFQRRFFLDYWSLKILSFTLKSIPFIFKNKSEIVMCFNGGWQPIILKIVSFFARFKLITSGQSGIGWDDRINLLVFPHAFVPISTKAYKWARKVNPLVKSVYIPNGVDLEKFKPNGEKIKTVFKHPVVLCVGALVLQKRIDLVIKAVSEIPDISLLIVGDGEEKPKLESLGRKLLGEKIEFLKLGHSQMPKVYRSADLFCLVPEPSEAFGIVYVEAMASNLGVIAIDDDQRKEIIGEAGILVKDPENIKSLTKAIKSGLKTNWGEEPRKRAQKFDWDRIADQYEELFLNL